MLWPVLARGLPSWASVASEFACLEASPAQRFDAVYTKCLYLDQIAEFFKKN
jgi:hypothetical protein